MMITHGYLGKCFYFAQHLVDVGGGAQADLLHSVHPVVLYESREFFLKKKKRKNN